MSKLYKYILEHEKCNILYIKKYLCNKFTNKILDKYNLTFREFCYRLKHKIKLNKKIKCIHCNKDIIFNPKCGYTKHCSVLCAQGSRKKNINNILNKMKATNIRKYGVDNPMKYDIFKEKSKTTSIIKYGVESPMQNDCIKEVLKHSLKLKYGVDNISKTKYWKDIIHRNKDIIQQKRYYTCKKNNSFNISKLQNEVYEKLKEKFNNVKSEYKSKLYPYKCDFYIECDFHWMHGKEPYNRMNSQHKKLLTFWKSKLKAAINNGNINSQYKHAIDIWTKIDPLKLETFKKNKLNYKIFYKIEDFYVWYDSIIS